MKNISKLAASIQPSATMAIDARVRELRSQGVTVAAFGGGEPNFFAAEAVAAAGIRAIENGQTKYTPAAGTTELRRAIAKRLEEDYSLHYEESQIVATTGGKYAIYAAFQVLLDSGDEVILPAPYWVSYAEQIRMSGGVPVIVSTHEENDFKITPEQLAAAVTEKTKIFIFNNPGNPTGTVYDRAEMAALAEICREKDLYVLSDEMYAKLLFDGAEFTSFPTLSDDAFARTILVNGASKAYAMTGWRIGYAAAPARIAKAMSSFLSQSTGCPSAVSQAAAAEAFSGPQDYVEVMRTSYEERRDYLVGRIRAIKGLSCTMPKGAFYLFVSVKELFGRVMGGTKITSDMDFAQALLETAHVAVTPGSAFGAPGYIRWCYAASLEELKLGADRLEAFVHSAE